MLHISRKLLLLGLSLASRIALAGEAPVTVPGLAQCFRSLHGTAASAPDCRIARLVALAVEPGAPPTPFLEAGAFEVVWTGYLEAEFLDDYTFSATGRGRFELRLGGELVKSGEGEDLSRAGEVTVELEAGRNPLQVTYRSPPTGAALFGLRWSSFDFRTEPVPPAVLSHSPDTPHLREGLGRRRGRELLATRRCVACHAPAESFSVHAMPELAVDAPSLTAAGSRLNPDWMARWIENPRALRRQATMPRMFRGGERDVDPRPLDIAAYLAGLRGLDDEIDSLPEPTSAHAASGRDVFDKLGCIGCHTTGEPRERPGQGDPALDERIDLRAVRSKWRPRALVRFLEDPQRDYRWNRMPDFRLSDAEARDLASYLLSLDASGHAPTAPPGGDPVRGKRLVETSGCLNCHRLELEPAPANEYRAPALDKIGRSPGAAGCLLDGPRPPLARSPELQLDDDDREVLRAFLNGGLLASLRRRDDLEYASRRMRALRCFACHSRDGRLDVWSTLSAGSELESGAPPVALPPADGEERTAIQTRPDLTWTGAKLRPDWLARFLGGELPYRVRPWLDARMPIFAVDGDSLARGLSLQHGLRTVPAGPPEHSNPRLAEIGRRLVVVDGGFSCVSCHEIGAYRLPGAAFDVRGINFKYVTRRLRKAFYHRWMLDPLRVVPGSKMPQFADDEGRTPFTDILDGDGPRQFEALWQYLLEGEDIRPPERG